MFQLHTRFVTFEKKITKFDLIFMSMDSIGPVSTKFKASRSLLQITISIFYRYPVKNFEFCS
jgi:hypothetical protein